MTSQYRVECAKAARAICTETKCKKEQTKIGKGELRLGTWTEIQDRGGWKWKHWGCVSGFQLQGIQQSTDNHNGGYEWDLVDGYDDLPDDTLKAKVRKAIEQGHVDEADFKGDPECNVPGHKGIRLTDAQRRKLEAGAASDDDKPKKQATKRGRAKASSDDAGGEESKPAAKAITAKAAKAAKAAKGKVSVKDEGEEEQEDDMRSGKSKKTAPTKSNKRKVKQEDNDNDDNMPLKKIKTAVNVKEESHIDADHTAPADELIAKPKKSTALKEPSKTKGKKSQAAVEPDDVTQPTHVTETVRRGTRRAAPRKSLKEQSDDENEKPVQSGTRRRKGKVDEESEPEFAVGPDEESEPEPEPDDSEPEFVESGEEKPKPKKKGGRSSKGTSAGKVSKGRKKR